MVTELGDLASLGDAASTFNLGMVCFAAPLFLRCGPACRLGFNSVNHPREERILQIRYDHPDHLPVTETQASGESIRAVIETSDGPSDASSRFLRNPIQTRQRA